MSAAEKILELPGLRVTVDRVVYQPDALSPPDRPHCFVYYITIHNDSDVTAVEGEGVVGQLPRIQPGEKFSYNSFHLLDARSAVAEGSYLGIDADGRKVLTRIPRFQMVVPEGN